MYEEEKYNYILFSNENPSLDINDGFKIANQGSRGFSNYIAISNVSFALYLINKYNKEPRDSFRVEVKEKTQLKDGLIGYKLDRLI